MSNDDTQDLRKERNSPLARQMMRQFLNTDGPKGNNEAYDRGYEFSFRFTDDMRHDVNWMMSEHAHSFESAFDIVMRWKKEGAYE